MGIPWPDDIYISRMRFQVRLPEQVVRRNPRLPPVSPRPPLWEITTILEPDDNRLAGRFLNSLGGAQQIVALPVLVDDALFEEDGRMVGSVWSATNDRENAGMTIPDGSDAQHRLGVVNVALGGRYTEVRVSRNAAIDPEVPPVGSMVRVGSADETRLYEVDAIDDTLLYLNPRVSPPTGTDRLFRADTVSVRMTNQLNAEWDVRDVQLPGEYPGTVVEWIEVFE